MRFQFVCVALLLSCAACVTGDGQASVPYVEIQKGPGLYVHDPYDNPVKTLPPRYPVEAIRSEIQGYVCFIFDISTEGDVSNLRIYDSSPKYVFDKVAVDVFLKWKFRAGDSVRSDRKYCLDFKLE